ncbi:glutamate receptor-like isoform X2 [Gigantopelta aegis]|uniref:glutamate receptor-like isoform X2 n=1 Tax=Gigantopelta aegis TaxID=1735272 RepID=UPI001B889C10|nr:glutamate receptor-like isoform X2 [Gigantopelta aegis]
MVCRQMSLGVFAILGQKEIISSDIVQSFTNTFHMPFVTTSLSHITARRNSGYELHLRPDYTSALIDVIEYLRWDHVHFLYDSDEGLLRIQRIFWSMRNHSVQWFSVKRFNDITRVHDDLRRLDRSNFSPPKNFVLDLSSEYAYNLVLKQIPEVGMNKDGYNYLLGSLDFKNLNLSRFIHGGVNVTGFQLLDTDAEFEDDFLKSMVKVTDNMQGQNTVPVRAALTVDSFNLIEQAIISMLENDSHIFRYNFRRGYVYTYNDTKGIPCTTRPPIPWMHGEGILNTMKKQQTLGMSGRLAFDENGFRDKYSLGVYSVSLENGPTKIGTWKTGSGFHGQNYEETIEQDVRQQPQQRVNATKIITSILVEPFLMRVTETNKNGNPIIGPDLYEGYCMDLATAVARHVGFEFHIKLVADNTYGVKLKNNTWNGMIGELLQKKADMAVAPLTITAERERFVDFSKPFMNIGIGIMIKKPEKEKPGVFSFLLPLSIPIWVCIIVAYIGVSVGLFLVSRFSPLEWMKSQKEKDDSGTNFDNKFSLMNSFWFSMGALMFQGSDLCPRSVSGRIIGGAWWFFVLIIISSYTANLAAFLTVERMRTPIESADDLAQQTVIKYGTVESGTTLTFFKESEVPTYRQMWNFMSANSDVFVKTVDEGIQKVRDSNFKYAFLLESSNIEYVNNRKPCDTVKVGPNLNQKAFGIATPRGSNLRDMVTLAVLTLKEDGTLYTLKNKWWYEKGQCGLDGSGKESSKRSLSLSNVAGVFYILIGGLVCSVILGVFEFLFFRAKRPTAYLPGTDTAQTLIISPNDRDDGNVPNDKGVAEYTYDTPKLIGFEAFNLERPDTDV